MSSRSYKKLKSVPEIPGYLVYFSLFLAVMIISVPLFNAGFVWYDDDIMFFNNHLLNGSFPEAVKNSFSFSGIVHYHPLVFISFAAEKFLFGSGPAALHITNIILHFLNSVLLYTFLKQLKFSGFSALAASLLFAVHPMHVESFAWITERKDVLYSLFFILSLIFYTKYRSGSGTRFYLLSLGAFILSCLSKSMAVSLPLVLLLIDRFMYPNKKTGIKDKVPFFVISALFAVVNLSTAFYFTDIKMYTVIERFSMITYSLLFYPVKLIIPVNLSAIYPYPQQPGLLYQLSIPAAAVLIFIVYHLRKYKILVFGCLFYLVTILPVIPFTPFGISITAERFSYIPSAGIFLAVIFSASRIISRLRRVPPEESSELMVSGRKIFNSTAAVLLVITLLFSYLSYNRCVLWQNTELLMNDVLRKDENNYYAYFILGNYYSASGMYERSVSCYNSFINLNCSYPLVYFNLGNVYYSAGNFRAAAAAYFSALALDPGDPLTCNNLGLTYENLGQNDSAMIYYRKSAELGYEPAKYVLRYYGVSY